VLLTDGRANVSLQAGRHPEAEALALATALGRGGLRALVIDTETGPVRLARAGALADAWGAPVKRLEELHGPRLPEAVRRALKLPAAS
jgi:magnesium chelatase subunit D